MSAIEARKKFENTESFKRAQASTRRLKETYASACCVSIEAAVRFALGQQELQRTRSAADIVESQVCDKGVHLEQQRKRLADTAGSTEDGDLGQLKCTIPISTL